MSLQVLFTTARTITAVYRIVSTTLLLLYIAKRVKDGRKISRRRRDASELFDRESDS